MSHHQAAASTGMKDNIYFSIAATTAYTDIIADGDAEPSTTPDWKELNLWKWSYCYSDPCMQDTKAAV